MKNRDTRKKPENKDEKAESLSDLMRRIEKLEEENQLLRKQVELSSIPHDMDALSFEGVDYDYNWSWVKRICYVIYQAKKPLQLGQIREALLNLDEQFKVVKYKTKMLSSHLLRAKKEQRLKRFKITGDGGYFYHL